MGEEEVKEEKKEEVKEEKKEEKKEVKMDAEQLAEEMEKRRLAAEEAKKEKERKKEERAKNIADRIGKQPDMGGWDEQKCRDYMNETYDRLMKIEIEKYDYERKIMVNNVELQDLKKQVMDLRGKFIIPNLKKVVIDFE